MDETVTVPFDPPAKVTNETGKSWMIQSDAMQTTLPKRQLAPLELGQELTELAMPKWLAVDRGFIEDDDETTSVVETITAGITRYDLIQAAAIHALMDRGNMKLPDLIYESEKIAHAATKGDK